MDTGKCNYILSGKIIRDNYCKRSCLQLIFWEECRTSAPLPLISIAVFVQTRCIKNVNNKKHLTEEFGNNALKKPKLDSFLASTELIILTLKKQEQNLKYDVIFIFFFLNFDSMLFYHGCIYMTILNQSPFWRVKGDCTFLSAFQMVSKLSLELVLIQVKFKINS